MILRLSCGTTSYTAFNSNDQTQNLTKPVSEDLVTGSPIFTSDVCQCWTKTAMDLIPEADKLTTYLGAVDFCIEFGKLTPHQCSITGKGHPALGLMSLQAFSGQDLPSFILFSPA